MWTIFNFPWKSSTKRPMPVSAGCCESFRVTKRTSLLGKGLCLVAFFRYQKEIMETSEDRQPKNPGKVTADPNHVIKAGIRWAIVEMQICKSKELKKRANIFLQHCMSLIGSWPLSSEKDLTLVTRRLNKFRLETCVAVAHKNMILVLFLQFKRHNLQF